MIHTLLEGLKRNETYTTSQTRNFWLMDRSLDEQGAVDTIGVGETRGVRRRLLLRFLTWMEFIVNTLNLRNYGTMSLPLDTYPGRCINRPGSRFSLYFPRNESLVVLKVLLLSTRPLVRIQGILVPQDPSECPVHRYSRRRKPRNNQ